MNKESRRYRNKDGSYVYFKDEKARKDISDLDDRTSVIVKSVNGKAPDETGNVDVEGGGGVGIQKIEQTKTSTESGGVNEITITETDGTEATFEVRNGKLAKPLYDEETGEMTFEASGESAVDSYARGQLAEKITKPEDAPTVGKVLKVKSVNPDGTFVCEWADGVSGGVEDVRVNNNSIVVDGIADMGISSKYGISFSAPKSVNLVNVPEANITDRTTVGKSGYGAINTVNFDFAVKAALTDGKGQEYTETQQKNARERIGIKVVTQEEYDLIDGADSDGVIYFIKG